MNPNRTSPNRHFSERLRAVMPAAPCRTRRAAAMPAPPAVAEFSLVGVATRIRS